MTSLGGSAALREHQGSPSERGACNEKTIENHQLQRTSTEKAATILAKIMWDTLAECTASTMFFTWKRTFYGPNYTFPPLPHAMLFERKGFPPSRPTLHGEGRGGGRASERIFELQEFCIKGIQVSHTFWPGLHVVRLIEAKSLQSHTADKRYSAVRLTRF